MFDLGELVRKTDTVCTTCKLLLYQIYAVQPNGNGTKELVQVGAAWHRTHSICLAERS